VDYRRVTLLSTCAGVTAEQLAERSCPPSPLSLLGLVRRGTLVAWPGYRLTDSAQFAMPVSSRRALTRSGW
jgi:hypothetical protein